MSVKFHLKLRELTLSGQAFSFAHKNKRITYVHSGKYSGLWTYNLDSKKIRFEYCKVLHEKEIYQKLPTKTKATSKVVFPIPLTIFSRLFPGNPYQAFIHSKKSALQMIFFWHRFCEKAGISGASEKPASCDFAHNYSNYAFNEVEARYLSASESWLKSHPPDWRERFAKSVEERGFIASLKKMTRLSPSVIQKCTEPISGYQLLRILHFHGISSHLPLNKKVRIIRGGKYL